MTAASLDHLYGLERRVLNDRQVRRVGKSKEGRRVRDDMVLRARRANGYDQSSRSGQ